MEIVIGLLSVIILLLLVLLVRSKMLGNNKGKGNMSEPQVTSSSMQKTNSIYINAPGQGLHFQQQNSEEHYECLNPDPEISAAIEDDSETYVELR
ncbi:uncharacterized protein LOC106871631 isoform X2 [Octopus bimaculoides]|uniref:Uncharacterized protein n=1 Tax=Octopus bimaculoides TaxID=37653 RepID=A0A0L8HC62_OCTBM|nr:uncharacterized protein LOC106871631 isoform X2 [Octopus bimaculoides]